VFTDLAGGHGQLQVEIAAQYGKRRADFKQRQRTAGAEARPAPEGQEDAAVMRTRPGFGKPAPGVVCRKSLQWVANSVRDDLSGLQQMGSVMDMETIPESVWREAERRADVLRPLAALAETSADRVRDAAHELRLSERWTYILIHRLREQGGELTALLPRQGRGAPRQARLAADREAILSRVIEAEYLTRQKVRPAQIVRSVRAHCRKAGVTAPAEATIRRRLRHIDRQAVSQSRVPDPRTQPVCGETPRPDYPLDFVQIDHTRVDVILVDPIERCPIGRPWLTVAIDVMSRAIAGFHLSLDAPSATSVGLCLAHMAAEKETWMAARGVTGVTWPLVGKPGTLGVDNGAELHAEAFTRGCSQHGIAIDWHPPGQP